MIAQQKLLWTGLQVNLVLQVPHAVLVYIVSDQGERDDQRYKLAAKIDQESDELLPLGGRKLFGKITRHVMQYITMRFLRRMDGEAFHEQVAVCLIAGGDGDLLNLGDKVP